MTPAEYDQWYRTPRGAWIGEVEYRLVKNWLGLGPGASVLDVGCGTGYFTRRLARDGFDVVGVDLDPWMVDYARSSAAAREPYLVGDACHLPYPNGLFDAAVAITSLCFIRGQEQALAEMVRVTRRRIALGLLNRHSLLYWQKGRDGGRGGYRGARWHKACEAEALLAHGGLQVVAVRSAIFGPGGGALARGLESLLPDCLQLGGFLLAVGEIPIKRVPPQRTKT